MELCLQIHFVPLVEELAPSQWRRIAGSPTRRSTTIRGRQILRTSECEDAIEGWSCSEILHQKLIRSAGSGLANRRSTDPGHRQPCLQASGLLQRRDGRKGKLTRKRASDRLNVRKHIMSMDNVVIEDWYALSEAEAIEMAIDRHGKDGTTSVAYCALEAWGDRSDPKYQFWFGLFLKLVQREHVGWA